MHILIFKTNIETEDAHREVAFLLRSHPAVLDWNVDREDIDKVLRIESKENNSHAIIQALQAAGYVCEELPD